MTCAVLRLDVKIFARQRMTLNAIGLPRVDANGAVPANKVLSPRHRLKMGRVHARSITTKMVKIQAFRDRPHKRLIDHAVSHSVSVFPDTPIAV